MARPVNRANRDCYLNSSRAKLVVAQPDRFYVNFIYETFRNCLYHMDVESIIVDKDLNIIAILETIKGLDKQITPFKKSILTQIAQALGVPFYIVNWDRNKNKATVTKGFTGSVQEQTLFEHKKWLRSLKNSASWRIMEN
jgi:hypothetical protein